MYTNLFTSVNTIFSMDIVFPDLKIYFIGTQTLPDGPRLPPLPGAVLFFRRTKFYFFANDFRNYHRGYRLFAFHRAEYRARSGSSSWCLRHECALQGDSARGPQGFHRTDHDAVRGAIRTTFGRARFARNYPVYGDAHSRILLCAVLDVLYGDGPL